MRADAGIDVPVTQPLLPGPQLVVVGIDHTTVPIDLRERVAFADSEVPAALSRLTDRDGSLLEQAAILSTCNRVEVYGGARSRRSRGELTSFLARYHGLDPYELKGCVYVHRGAEVAHHRRRRRPGCTRSCSGRHRSRARCVVRWSTGSQPAPLAPSCGACSSRRVCGSAGALAHGPCSWTSERLAREHRARSPAPRDAEPVHSAADRRRDDGRARAKHRPRELLVIGRGSARAGRLAEHYGGRALTSDQLREALARSDVVISSTSAPYAIVDRDQLEHALTDRGGANPRPLLLIDRATPRDVAPAVAGLTGVEIYTIDDLRPVVERARATALKCALEQISPLSANDREVLDAMTRGLARTLLQRVGEPRGTQHHASTDPI